MQQNCVSQEREKMLSSAACCFVFFFQGARECSQHKAKWYHSYIRLVLLNSSSSLQTKQDQVIISPYRDGSFTVPSLEQREKHIPLKLQDHSCCPFTRCPQLILKTKQPGFYSFAWKIHSTHHEPPLPESISQWCFLLAFHPPHFIKSPFTLKYSFLLVHADKFLPPRCYLTKLSTLQS